jgi:hypothetical protein
MSIPVPIAELDAQVAAFPWGYLMTVNDAGVARCLAVATRRVDGAFLADVGEGTARNVATRPAVAIVFPPASGTEHSLVVDGRAELDGTTVRVIPTSAVLHRPALG